MTPTVAVLTDFGLRDGYVGAMKGAMLAREPGLRFVDVTHQIEPGDVAGAAWVLAQSAPHFPTDCVFLVVVDPGVGGQRRALACLAGGRRYVAPDNGVLHWVVDEAATAHEIRTPETASPVFHGRDVFGPAAADLAAGAELAGLGPSVLVADLARLPFAPPNKQGSLWSCSVVHIDRFGNAITDLVLEEGTEGVVEVTGHRVRLRRTYSDVGPGEPVALRGSSNTLELSCNGSSAAESLGIARGDVITFRLA